MMNAPVRRMAAAVILPPELQVMLTTLRDSHGLPPWEASIPFHVTLVSPFTTHATDAELGALWEPVAERREPFPITLDGFDRFDPEDAVLLVAVLPQPLLNALADDALAAVQQLRLKRSRPFIPHVTLANRAPSGTVDEWMARVAGEHPRGEFLCDRFSMLELDERVNRWNVVRDFPFHP